VNGNDYSGAVYSPDAFERWSHGGGSPTWDRGGDVQASARAMANRVQHNQTIVRLKMISACLGAISSISGLLAFVPCLTPLASAVSIVTGGIAAAIDCSIELISVDCGVGVASIVTHHIGSKLTATVGTRFGLNSDEYYRASNISTSVSLGFTLGGIPMSASGFTSARSELRW